MATAKALKAAGIKPCSDRLYASSTVASALTCRYGRSNLQTLIKHRKSMQGKT